MFSLRPDGSMVEIIRETAVVDQDRGGMGFDRSQGNVRIKDVTTVSLARLVGQKANFRYSSNQDIRIIAVLPNSVDPRKIELASFESRGPTRITYLRPFNGATVSKLKTYDFRARQLKDGRWLFEPESQLAAGEYCFSPKFNNDNYCFGIDKK